MSHAGQSNDAIDDRDIIESILNGDPTPTKPKRRKRNYPTQTTRINITDIYETLGKFKRRKDSIRLSASSIAAMSGFHPYSNLPKLLMDLVYQGPVGQLLLQHDAKLLNIEMISEEEALKKIAKKAGGEVQYAFQVAIDVSKGRVKVKSVQDANGLKSDILSKVKKSKVLSKGEAKQLAEATRYNVNTGFGKEHEEDALDLYEIQCGWEVRCRNDDMKCWKFQRDGDDVFPVGPAESLYRGGRVGESKQEGGNASKDATIVVIDDDEDENDASNPKSNTGSSSSQPIEIDSQAIGQGPDGKDAVDTTSPPGSTSLEPIEIHSQEICEAADGKDAVETNSAMSPPPPPSVMGTTEAKPFFFIIGIADGIRDELAPGDATKPDNEDDWALRQVVVELKHRMKSAFNPPPIYDQIQTVLYCMMYGTNEGEIVQVVRNKHKRKKQETKATVTSEDGGGEIEITGTMKEAIEAKESAQEAEAPKAKTSITCNRVSLDDPIMQHRQNWHAIILPRLRSFVDAAYSIRQNDDKRYRIIREAAIVSSGGDETTFWQILLDECPWLVDCDTAFSKR